MENTPDIILIGILLFIVLAVMAVAARGQRYHKARSKVDSRNVTFSVIELPSMELLVLCPVRQLTGEQPQS